MNRKAISASSRDVQANESPSVITRIRRGRHVLPTRTRDGVKDAHLPESADSGATKAINVKADASALYSTDTPLLGQLIGWVRSYPNERILRLPQVVTITGRSRPAVWSDVNNGTFPRALALGAKARGWRASEVMGWVEATTILSRVANPGFEMKEFVAALMASRIPMR
jgi:predicted DNA-binding transcriptional regulator AlpA